MAELSDDEFLKWYSKYLRAEKKLREEAKTAKIELPPDPPEVGAARLRVHQRATLLYYQRRYPDWKMKSNKAAAPAAPERADTTGARAEG